MVWKEYSTFRHSIAIKTPNFLSQLGFTWASQLSYSVQKRQQLPEDWQWPLIQCETNILPDFKRSNLLRYVWIGLMQLICIVIRVLGPSVVIYTMVLYAQASELKIISVVYLIGGFYIAQIVRAYLETHTEFQLDILGARFTAILQSQLFEKAMQSSTNKASQLLKSPNHIQGFTSLLRLPKQFLATAIACVQILVILVVYFELVGWSIVVGVGVIAVLVVLRTYIAYLAAHVRLATTLLTTRRLETTKEMIEAMLNIKLFTWEDYFNNKLQRIREQEVDLLRAFSYYITAWSTLMYSTPVFGLFTVVLTSTLWFHQELSIATIFACLSLADILRSSIVDGAASIKSVLEAIIIVREVDTALTQIDLNPTVSYLMPPTAPVAMLYKKDHLVLSIDNGAFAWPGMDTPLLEKIDFKVYREELVVIHGEPGQGKSSLLSCLLGNMCKVSGSVFVDGAIAYCAASPWIQSTTLRETILFGKPYDRMKYQRILDSCDLTHEITSLAMGDRTWIGSTFQPTPSFASRLVLARACYSDAEILLLDGSLDLVLDPVAADSIFMQCLVGYLRNKTVVLVSNDSSIIASEDVNRTFLVQGGE